MSGAARTSRRYATDSRAAAAAGNRWPFTFCRATLKPKPAARRNEPAYLPHIAAAVARARGESMPVLAAASTAATRALFQTAGGLSESRRNMLIRPLIELPLKSSSIHCYFEI